jgi:hypothetical protein
LRPIPCLQTRIEIHLIFYNDSTYFHKLKPIPDKSSAIVLEVFEERIEELQKHAFELTAAANTKVNSVHSQRYTIQHEPTTSYSPQSNGKAERLNRTLIDSTVPAMLFQPYVKVVLGRSNVYLYMHQELSSK